jgi:hypothetical protein
LCTRVTQSCLVTALLTAVELNILFSIVNLGSAEII